MRGNTDIMSHVSSEQRAWLLQEINTMRVFFCNLDQEISSCRLCEMDDERVWVSAQAWRSFLERTYLLLWVVQHSSFRTRHLIDAREPGWLVRVWLPLRLQWSLTVVGMPDGFLIDFFVLSLFSITYFFFFFFSTCERCAVEDCIFWTPVTWSTFIPSSVWLSNRSHQEYSSDSSSRWWSWLNETVCDPLPFTVTGSRPIPLKKTAVRS